MSIKSITKSILKKLPVSTSGTLKNDELPKQLFDSNHTWIFNAGNLFVGNPKWLFLYVINYRKDIDAYWFSYSEETNNFVRSLGYRAYSFKDEKAIGILNHAGVYIVENVREVIPPYIQDSKLINLFHGVGVKSIERRLTSGFLNERITKKYIRNNQYYRNNQLFLVTSPFMEEHFRYQCGIDEDKVIRAGYPRCVYHKYYDRIATFDHDLRRKKGLSADSRIAAYVPTYRDQARSGVFLQRALPDMNRLIQRLSDLNMLMIIKMHPMVADTPEFRNIVEEYENCPNLYFWNNNDDFYEILDQIDLGIIDYSSIYYDMLECGTENFIRYFFDYNEQGAYRELSHDVMELTSGPVCKTFDQLLEMLDKSSEYNEPKARQSIRDRFWSYSDSDTMETIVEAALAFEPDQDRDFPVLHTFDVFSSIFTQKVIDGDGIYYRVMDAIRQSAIAFPEEFYRYYPDIRKDTEDSMRRMIQGNVCDDSSKAPLSLFVQTLNRIRDLYGFNDEQVQFLLDEERKAEYDNIQADREVISQLKGILAQGDDVILVTDSCYERSFITEILDEADQDLVSLPLYTLEEIPYSIRSKSFFINLYHQIQDYTYKKWIHHGDHRLRKEKYLSALCIDKEICQRPVLNAFEREMIRTINTYDACLLVNSFVRFRNNNCHPEDYFSYAYLSSCFVPYVYWMLGDAADRGLKHLCFISNDGYHLKNVADALIKIEKYPISTSYFFDMDSDAISEDPDYDYSDQAVRQRHLALDYCRQELESMQDFAFVSYQDKSCHPLSIKRMVDSLHEEETRIPFYFLRTDMGSEENCMPIIYTVMRQSEQYLNLLLSNMPFKKAEAYRREGGKVIPVRDSSQYDKTLFDAMERCLVKFSQDLMSISYNNRERLLRDYARFGLSYLQANPEDKQIAEYLGRLPFIPKQQTDVREFAPAFTEEIINDLEQGQAIRTYTESRDLSLTRTDPALQLRFESFNKSKVIKSRENSNKKKQEQKLEKLEAQGVKALETIRSKTRVGAEQREKYQRLLDIDIEKGKTVVFEKADHEDPARLYSLIREIGEEHVIYYTDQSKITSEMLENIATANYLILSYNAGIISNLIIRPETKVIQTWYDAFQFRNSGLMRKSALDNITVMEMEKLLRDYRIDAFPVGSDLSAKRFRQFIHPRNKEAVMAIGSPITDIYFDEDYKREKKEYLYNIFPEAKSKKIILFMPVNRKRKNKKQISRMFDLSFLKESLQEEYVFVIHSNQSDKNNECIINESERGFAKDVTGQLSVREVMCCADIIVGDYSNEFFESVFLDVPKFLTCEDYKSFVQSRDISLPYEEFAIGSPVYDSRDLVNRIADIDCYDNTPSELFRNRYFSQCDGNSAKRLMSYLKA